MKNQAKLVLITGAASGIGKATAELLYSQGYRLWLIDINQEALQELQNTLPGSKITVCDLTNRDHLEDLSQQIERKPRLDIAFINAGTIVPGDFIDLTFDKCEFQVKLNLWSALYLNYVCGRKMKMQAQGHLISTVSMGGIIGLKGSATYSATKFGLRGFLMAFRNEMKPFGVAVSGLYLSAIDTPMLRYEATHEKGSPLNFLSQPVKVEKVAQMVLKIIKRKRLENYLPFGDSLSAKFFGAFPGFIPKVYPMLRRLGEKGRRKFIRKNGLKPIQHEQYHQTQIKEETI
ncbi:hypothetical protein BKI52_22095 [marine bacterium AO1-C]|nr:hypothetical protein BKI52_22095 [marine bacterium AO1-C]